MERRPGVIQYRIVAAGSGGTRRLLCGPDGSRCSGIGSRNRRGHQTGSPCLAPSPPESPAPHRSRSERQVALYHPRLGGNVIDIVRTAWDAKAADWARRSGNPRGFWNRRLRAISDLAVRYVRSGSSLDVGCGPGVLCRMLAEAGFDVHGTDVSGNMLHEAAALLEISDEEAASRLYHSPDDPIPFFPEESDSVWSRPSASSSMSRIESASSVAWPISWSREEYLILSNSQNGSLFVALCIASHVLRFRREAGRGSA